MRHPSRGPAVAGIDGKSIAASRRTDTHSTIAADIEAARMRHPSRGPAVAGIDGKSIAAGRRTDTHSTITADIEAARVRHPAKGPAVAGIDGKPSAADRRIPDVAITLASNEAARMRHPSRGPAVAEIDGKPGAASAITLACLAWRTKSLSSMGNRALSCLLALALAACTAMPEKEAGGKERWYETMVEPLQSEPDKALRFYDRIIRLKGAELTRELDAARQAYDRERTELSRVQLAMILSLPGAPFRDDHAAAQLLQPFAKDSGLEQSELRPLALLLGAQLAENRRHEEAWQQQVARAKEEQRKADDLQQKLDALLEMEKKLIEREQSIPTKKK